MLLPAIVKRRAVRDFKTDPVPESMIQELLTAAFFAPTARNRRVTEFVVITDQKTKEALHAALVPQEFVKEAPVIIVPAIDTQRASKPVEDLTLASQNIFLQAVHLGLGSVWKHVHEGEELEKVRAILGIPEHFLAINVIPVGFAKEPPPPHAESEVHPEKIHFGRW